jgi:hypothetical protein
MCSAGNGMNPIIDRRKDGKGSLVRIGSKGKKYESLKAAGLRYADGSISSQIWRGATRTLTTFLSKPGIPVCPLLSGKHWIERYTHARESD